MVTMSYSCGFGTVTDDYQEYLDVKRRREVREMTEPDIKSVNIGDCVAIVDEQYHGHHALVTVVHGHGSKQIRDEAMRNVESLSDEEVERIVNSEFHFPVINVVYVSIDPTKHDPYGRQVERLSSLQYFEEGPNRMERPGRYWQFK